MVLAQQERGRERGVGGVRVVELLAGTVLVVEQAIVARSGSRPRNQGRLPPHLTTPAGMPFVGVW